MDATQRTEAARDPATTSRETIDAIASRGYDAGFFTDIEADAAPPGLDESIVRFISAKKNEPEWLLEWRLDAFRRWQKMEEPTWAHVDYPKIDFQAISYYSAPKIQASKRVEDLTPEERAQYDELMRTYERLGVPVN